MSLPLVGALGFFLWFMPDLLTSPAGGAWSLSGILAYQIVTFFYYGWFYREKKASPGKMVMNIEVIQPATGAKLSYLRSYLRESLGKYVSGLILCLGYIVAIFRQDHRALHDLIFETQVIEKR